MHPAPLRTYESFYPSLCKNISESTCESSSQIILRRIPHKITPRSGACYDRNLDTPFEPHLYCTHNYVEKIGTLKFLLSKISHKKWMRVSHPQKMKTLDKEKINIVNEFPIYLNNLKTTIIPPSYYIVSSINTPNLYLTKDIGESIAIAAIGYDTHQKPIVKGLIHLISQFNLLNHFLEKLQQAGAVSVSLFVAGGHHDALNSMRNAIDQVIRSKNLPIEIKDHLMNPYQVDLETLDTPDIEIYSMNYHKDRAIHYHCAVETLQFTLDMGISPEGIVLIRKNGLIDKFQAHKVMRLSIFFSSEELSLKRFATLCKKTSSIREETLDLLITTIKCIDLRKSRQHHLKHTVNNIFFNNLKFFLHYLQTP